VHLLTPEVTRKMKRVLVLTLISLPFLAVAPAVEGCGSASELPGEGSTSETASCDKDALPALCAKCSDGSSACAHWVVVDGQCTVVLCGD